LAPPATFTNIHPQCGTIGRERGETVTIPPICVGGIK
jgi:hypothetical protein